MTYAADPPIDIRHLFVDPDMFDASKSFRKAGFDVVDRSHDTKIMVGSHDDAPGFRFKRYNNERRLDEQLENYQARVEGARLLHTFIEQQGLRNIVVPRKWIYELPPSFARERKGKLLPSHVLIVDSFDLMDKDDVKDAYGSIDEQTLRELCIVMRQFPGLDSTHKNVPFTEDGRIAFIDTESWNSHEGRKGFKYIREYLSAKRWKQAREIFDELDEST